MRTTILRPSLIAFAVALAGHSIAADNSCLGSGDITSQAQFAAYKSRCAACGGTWTSGRHPQTGQTTEYCKLPDAPSTTGGAPAPTNPIDALARAATAGSNRNAAQVLSQYNAQMTADAMRSLIQGDPAAEARRRAAAQQAAAMRAAQDAREAERAQGLLGEMLGTESTTDSEAQGADPSGLGLMLGDDPVPRATGSGSSVMPNSNPRPTPNPQPGAAVGTPRPAAAGSLAASLMTEDQVQPPAKEAAVPFDSFTPGFNHGAGCFSQNAGATCSAAAPEQFEACLAGYRNGYGEGEKQKEQRLADAHRKGASDRAAGRRADANTLSDAVGTCRIEIIQAYQRGFAGSPL